MSKEYWQEIQEENKYFEEYDRLTKIEGLSVKEAERQATINVQGWTEE